MKLRLRATYWKNEELRNAEVRTLNGTDLMNPDCTLG